MEEILNIIGNDMMSYFVVRRGWENGLRRRRVKFALWCQLLWTNRSTLETRGPVHCSMGSTEFSEFCRLKKKGEGEERMCCCCYRRFVVFVRSFLK